MAKTLTIVKKNITIEDIWKVANNEVKIEIAQDTKNKIRSSREVIKEAVNKRETVYGVNTGFGSLKNKRINKNEIKQLQKNLIRSHSVGVGNFLNKAEVRAVMFVRLLSLAQGYSGVRLEVVEKLVELLNKDIIPCIPSQGSVGCSGDLAPLSHMTLVLMGEGEILERGNTPVSTKKVFRDLKIKPIELEEKEGLALNNGTAVMTAIAALNIKRAENSVKTADIAGAISLETLMGTLTAFNEEIQKIRPHQGHLIVSRNFKKLCRDSEIMKSHKRCDRIQDSYSLRCIPQVHGAIRDAVGYCKKVVETEINSVTDNPLVFPNKKEIVSGGNFHGEPIALVSDFLAIALADLGNISERRIFKLLTPALNEGLPPFLIGSKSVGLNSGFMLVQYTAASLVAENKVYAHPVSVDSIPTSAGQEDHVSFGTVAAIKCKKIIDNLENILAIELLCGCQAAEFRKPLKLGKGNRLVYKLIRKKVKKVIEDRRPDRDINKIRDLIRSNALTNALANRKILVS